MAPRRCEGRGSAALYELSGIVLNLLRSHPRPISFSGDDFAVPPSSSRRPAMPQITPAGFGSLLLGVSMSLMLCGSVTFFIGFMLMPWVFGLVVVFHLAGMVSSLTILGRSLFFSVTDPPKKIPCESLFHISPSAFKNRIV
ncbi:hypothetical protein SAY87_013079 [Trapa incisa]|uniref:Uncharacterized protein n=1 Tax=Trapa incisa TaxID=236973 RepID=A0AAN7KGH0_9MYRT|nr:hypothetical protein SAY87_013079 [Trapa incisa]